MDAENSNYFRNELIRKIGSKKQEEQYYKFVNIKKAVI